MTKKENFIKMIEHFLAMPNITDIVGEDVDIEVAINYFNAFKESKEKSKSEMTENGKNILAFLQKTENDYLRAKDIAEGLEISSRSVSGAMRKLVTDGYVEKIGDSPASYSLTQKGIEFSV